ncbi:MAG: flagellar motor switch protein FliN [Gammaproteobacteria bacterium]|nr:flagellar motor switch protein FliN [Gammaproteobacteria bacterium]HBW84763.1 flagellar motor switch protein FliN [Gammaproteobacteria bacterium]|tara:strand:- start:109 stop:483 length:375 start_codon:yes stop_codon:yes gene_type:complete
MNDEEIVGQDENEQTTSGGGSEIAADNNPNAAGRGESQTVDKALLNSIPVSISVELGRKRLKISELMDLKKGAVVPLESLAGEPLQVFVNDTLLAKGDIVLVDERYGIKLTHIVPKTERLKSSD